MRSRRHNVGQWAGPGYLLLIDGQWRHVDPHTMSPDRIRDLESRSTACVGRGEPRIQIDVTRADPPPQDTVAP